MIDTSKALGASEGDLANVTYGLGQAMSRTIVQMEEFNQVTEPLPSLAGRIEREIRKMTGNGTANIRDLIEAGELTRDLFATALVRAMRDFEGAGEASLTTLAGRMTALANQWERLKRGLGGSAVADFGLRVVEETAWQLNPWSGRYDKRPEEAQLLEERAQAATRLLEAEVALEAAIRRAEERGRDPETSSPVRARRAAIAAAQAEISALEERLGRIERPRAEGSVASEGAAQAQAEAAAREAAQARFRATEEGRRLEAVAALDRAWRQFEEDRDKGRLKPDEIRAMEADLAARRAKLEEAAKPKASTTRDRAAEAEAELAHARAMAQAAQIRDEAERRSAEIALLAERAAERSGYDPVKQSGEYARVREAEAEQLRAQDRIKAAEEARRKAAQDAATADRERARKDAEALREQEAALKKITEIDREAAVATAAWRGASGRDGGRDRDHPRRAHGDRGAG